MMATNRPRRADLPLGPVLARFRAGLGEPVNDPLDDTRPTFAPEKLDQLSDAEFGAELLRFATRALPIVFHPTVFARKARFLRYGVAHLLHGRDPLPYRLARCVAPNGAYHVPGVGPGFWAALARVAIPDVPVWSPATEAGLVRLGLSTDPARTFEERLDGFFAGVNHLRSVAADLTAEQISHFLARVSAMVGRELPVRTEPGAFTWSCDAEAVRQAVRQVRATRPLRQRLRETPPERIEAVRRFAAEAEAGHYEAAYRAFRAADPAGSWEDALPALNDAAGPFLPTAERCRIWCETVGVLRDTFHVHPLEFAEVVRALGSRPEPTASAAFSGFCSDTFAFLRELSGSNSRSWMTANRDRYHFVLREPLVELCREVADRYVRPVLDREHGWDMESEARVGRALTSICRNDFGRGQPYQPVQWITFYRRCRGTKRADAQFFVRVAADGVSYGFHLGRSARETGRLFRAAIREHAELVIRTVRSGSWPEGLRFWVGDDLRTEVPVRDATELRSWSTHKTLAAGVRREPTDPALRGSSLTGEILLAFDRLLPLFACAAEGDPRPLLRRRGSEPDAATYDRAAFRRDTYLSEAWLDRVLELLRLKRQLVLQGAPGTGKTHVARCLARLLTGDRPGRVRFVQFHPAYSYEEFVEGIRVRNTGGEVSYAVEDGVLCEFAARAAACPGEPHVMIVDELNRGNLPRILGELLFLLEYRDQSVTLPYSRRSFRLPDNLYLLATMNPLDRTATALDQALRRRFSFVEMPADPGILARWLEEHAPSDDDEAFGPRTVRLFEQLNARLTRHLGPAVQIGHSFFMVPGLNRQKLATVWEHHVRPLLLDYLGGRSERLRDYEPARLVRSLTPGQTV
jgi:5-methylcytosine-specific restriction protein B